MKYTEFLNDGLKAKKNIVLIAHDNRKSDLVDWVSNNQDVLRGHDLFGTGTTARLINEATELQVTAFKSGPLGGDQQIGAKIVEGEIDVMIFYWDPLEAQPHDPDVKALLRIAVLYDIPVASNQATTDFIFSSPLMRTEYKRKMLPNSK